jgi:hypothetical protein
MALKRIYPLLLLGLDCMLTLDCRTAPYKAKKDGGGKGNWYLPRIPLPTPLGIQGVCTVANPHPINRLAHLFQG